MPIEPAISAGGAHTIKNDVQPIRATAPPMTTSRARSVASTLRRMRGRWARVAIRGPIIIANTGPRPNMISGLRNRR